MERQLQMSMVNASSTKQALCPPVRATGAKAVSSTAFQPAPQKTSTTADTRCTERRGPRQRRQPAGVPARVGEGGYLQRIDLTTRKETVVADNLFRVPFCSPNDAVVKRDGSIWFTDPNFGSVQGFRGAPKGKQPGLQD